MKTHLPLTSSLFIVLSLLALSFLSSCETDNNEVTPLMDISCRLIHRNISGDIHGNPDSINYQYDNQARLLKEIAFYQGKEKATTTYEYNTQGQLVKQTLHDKARDNQNQYTIDLVDVSTYQYNAKGQVVQFTTERTVPQKGNYHYQEPSQTVFEYDSEGNRTKVVKTVNLTSAPVQFTRVYTYQNGNCLKYVSMPGSPNEIVIDYEYDLSHEDKLQSFYETYLLLTEGTPNKNMVKKSVTSYKQSSNPTKTYEHAYEYDNNGNAIKDIITVSTSVSSNKAMIIHSRKYDCH